MYTIYDPTTLDAALTDAEYVTYYPRDEIDCRDNLLAFLEKQPNPYFNYVLFVYDEKGQILPLYVGYTNDLENRLKTHARRVEFDEVYIYHCGSKETALANEQKLMTMLGTCALFNGSLTQMNFVDRTQIMTAIEAQGGPPDPICRFAQAPSYTRRTYYLTPVLVEALRIWSFAENLDLSAAARMGMVQGIPDEHLESAYQQVCGKKVTA